jgi:hypothetical protein
VTRSKKSADGRMLIRAEGAWYAVEGGFKRGVLDRGEAESLAAGAGSGVGLVQGAALP